MPSESKREARELKACGWCRCNAEDDGEGWCTCSNPNCPIRQMRWTHFDWNRRAEAEGEKPTHKISACYFPGRKEAEFTWMNIESGEEVEVVTAVTEEIGNKLAEIVPACIYHKAIIRRAAPEGVRGYVTLFAKHCLDNGLIDKLEVYLKVNGDADEPVLITPVQEGDK